MFAVSPSKIISAFAYDTNHVGDRDSNSMSRALQQHARTQKNTWQPRSGATTTRRSSVLAHGQYGRGQFFHVWRAQVERAEERGVEALRGASRRFVSRLADPQLSGNTLGRGPLRAQTEINVNNEQPHVLQRTRVSLRANIVSSTHHQPPPT